jgi:hypothetical protein
MRRAYNVSGRPTRLDARASVPRGYGGGGAPRRIVWQRVILARGRALAGGLVPRGNGGAALQRTDGRLLILTVERELRDAPWQARR